MEMESGLGMNFTDQPSEVARSLDDYLRGIDDLKMAVEGLSLEQLRAHPIPGKWSILEVVCHLADTEIYLTDRMERTIALVRPLLIGVDETRYPDSVGYQNLNLEEEISLISALRRRTARILSRQPADAWGRTAIHSEVGLVTLQDLFQKAIGHFQHHLTFIHEKRNILTR